MNDAGLVVVGANDGAHLRDGWFDLEEDPRCGVRYRWAGPEASFELELPEGARRLMLLVSGAATVLGRPVPLSLYAGGRRVGHAEAAALVDAWTPVEFELADVAAKGNKEWVLRTETLAAGAEPETRGETVEFVPALTLGNGDYRRLGIMVAAIRATG